MSAIDLKTALTLREWDEAWEQSRHLETMRSQYLGFFFAATLGVTAVTANGLVGHHASPSATVVVVGMLALGLNTLAVYIYLAIWRVNQVLDHYQEIILTMRQQARLNSGSPIDLSDHVRPPVPPRPGRLGRLVLWHGSELILPLAATGSTTALVANAIYALTTNNVTVLAQVVSCIALVASVTVAGLCYWLLHPRPIRESRR